MIALWFFPGPARNRSTVGCSELHRRIHCIIPHCREGDGTHTMCFEFLVGFHSACLFFIFFFPVTGRKASFVRSSLPPLLPFTPACVPSAMSNPTTLDLKFVYPAAKYHQDTRTVTIYKQDPVTQETSGIYRVRVPITATILVDQCFTTPVRTSLQWDGHRSDCLLQEESRDWRVGSHWAHRVDLAPQWCSDYRRERGALLLVNTVAVDGSRDAAHRLLSRSTEKLSTKRARMSRDSNCR